MVVMRLLLQTLCFLFGGRRWSACEISYSSERGYYGDASYCGRCGKRVESMGPFCMYRLLP